MSFTINIFAGRLVCLRTDFLELIFDPDKFRCGKFADGFIAYAFGCGNADQAGLPVNSKVNVFNIYPHYIYGNAAYLNLGIRMVSEWHIW